MLNNNISNYHYPTFDYTKNVTLTESKQLYSNSQETIPYIFSPLNNNINMFELSSLGNNNNSSFGVKVKKLHSFQRQNIININSGKKILVLDLDETLVHSSAQKPFPNKKNIIMHMNLKNIDYTIYVIVRPYLDAFLEEMSLCYDLYLFTASLEKYSNTLLKYIDKNKVIKQVLNRDHCKIIKGVLLKDLSIFKKDLKDIIIIDNNPVSYALNKTNGIPIKAWFGDVNDRELLKLIPIMKYLSKVNDVRPIINKILKEAKTEIDFFKVNEILKHNKIKQNTIQSLNVSREEKELLNEKLGRNNTKISSNNSKTITFSPNGNYNTISNDAKKNKIIKIDISEKEIEINDIPDGKIYNKIKVMKKTKITLFKRIPSKKDKEKKPLNKKAQPPKESNRQSNIYNISIENYNNIQNKINIFNNNDLLENNKELFNTISDHPNSRAVTKIKYNKNNYLAKNKSKQILHPNIKKEKIFNNIKNEIKNKDENATVDNNNDKIIMKTEINEKYPNDTIKTKKNKELSINKKNIIDKKKIVEKVPEDSKGTVHKEKSKTIKNINKKIVKFKEKTNNNFKIEGHDNSHFEIKSTKTFYPEKKNTIVFTTILNKQSDKKNYYTERMSYQLNNNIIKIMQKKFGLSEKLSEEKFLSEFIALSKNRTNFEKI